jgi:hypothetical protein
VSEHLNGTALVGGDCDCVCVLLDGRTRNLVGTPVMPKVDYLATLALENPPEDSYGRVVAIENRGCGDNANGHFPAGGCDWGIGCTVPKAAFHTNPKT